MKIFDFTKPSNSFSGNVLKLMTGAAFAQVLGLLVSPIVTRFFASDAYGVAALFLSITSIIGILACLRYELAIMLPKTNEEAANILGVCFCSTVLITIITAVVVIFCESYIIQMTNAPELKKYLWLIPVAIFLTGISSALSYWNTRTKHFGRISVLQVISAVATQATKIAAGFAGFVSGGILIMTGILGSIVLATALGGIIWKNDKKLFIENVRWKGITAGFVRFKKFFIIDTWGGLLNTISWQLPALMLSSFFSISIVGFYALGLSIIMRPLSIISGSLSQVFFQKASEEKNLQGNNALLVERLMDRLMFIGILPITVLAVVGEEIFSVIFGARWFEAGRYAQILAPWLFFWFISSPLSTIFLVYERQGTAFLVNFIIFLTRVISLYIGGIQQNIYLALGLFSATGVVAYAFYAYWNIALSKANGKRIFYSLLKNMFQCLPIALCLFLFKYAFHFKIFDIILLTALMLILHIFIFRNKFTNLFKTEFRN